jgi:hypothetical protein
MKTLTLFALKIFRTVKKSAQGLYLQAVGLQMIANCTEQKSGLCNYPSGKLSKLIRTSSFKPSHLKTPKCRKKVFTGLYLHEEEAQIQ